MKSITQLITLHGGLSALAAKPIRIENEPWMRLVIEHVGEGPSGFPMISVAHYGEQNGDAMRDPEITFQLVAEPNPASPSFYPVEFLNDYAGFCNRALWAGEDGRVLSNPRIAREIMDFTRIWDRNLRAQGFIPAYRRSIKPQTIELPLCSNPCS